MKYSKAIMNSFSLLLSITLLELLNIYRFLYNFFSYLAVKYPFAETQSFSIDFFLRLSLLYSVSLIGHIFVQNTGKHIKLGLFASIPSGPFD